MLELKDGNIPQTSGIYKIEILEEGFVYIGSSNSITRRIKEHRCYLKNNKHYNTSLQKYYNEGYTLQASLVEEVLDLHVLWEKELYHIYDNEDIVLNETHYTKNRGDNKYITKEEVENIASLYNSGMSATAVALKIYGTRDKRANVACIVRGDCYPNFKHLFNYRKFTQKGKKRGAFSGSPKYRHLEYSEKIKQIEIDKKYIIKNIGILSGRQISKNLNLNCKTIADFIKKYKEDNNIDWGEKMNSRIRHVYIEKYGFPTERYTKDNVFIDRKESMNAYKKEGFYSAGIMKSDKTGETYRGFIFKIVKNEL